MMDFEAEKTKLQQEIQNIRDAANVEIGKRQGQLELIAKLEKEQPKEKVV